MNEADISNSTDFHDSKWHLVPTPETARGPTVYIYCETSNASPRAAYALLAARNLGRKNDMHTCVVENANWCKKMWGYDHAALGLCGPWGFVLDCSMAAEYYKHLISKCQLWRAGTLRVGGYARIINTKFGEISICIKFSWNK